MITMSREEFATKRFNRQEQAIETLTPIVAKALDNYAQEDWWRTLLAPARLLFNDVLREDSADAVRRDVRAWATLSKQLRDSLPKTGKPDEYTAKTIATWISTAVINWAAITAAGHDSEQLIMEWVTMHDDKVRSAHKDTDGQQRPVGEMFEVDGVPMMFPGDTSAPIELWINCRCAVRPAQMDLAAAAVEGKAAPKEGRVIVALPASDDPVHDLAVDEPHLTLIWLGSADDNPDVDMAPIHAAVADRAAASKPFTAEVDRVEPLGDDGAIVWMLSEHPAATYRNELLTDPNIDAAYGAVKQYPHFTPHTTIGYDLLLSGDGIDELSAVEQITYDRLAVWDGENRAEYPLGEAMSQVAAASSVTDDPAVLRWHGILAPEGVWSGDGRMFAPDSLRFRDLPLPLTWQKASGEGHDGSVVIAKIDTIERVDGMIRGEGPFVSTPETDEAVGLIAEFGRFGVSVDADDAEFEFAEDDSENAHGGKITFTSARIASASMVAIPAFAEAFIALGTWAEADGAPPTQMPPSEVVDPECDPAAPDYEDCVAKKGAASLTVEAFVSDKPWSQFTQADYTDEQWYSACVLHKNGQSKAKSDNGLPIKEPGGALNRNGVHAAAGRFNQVDAPPEAKASAAAALRGAYKQIGEDPPDAIKAASVTDTFGRGPGWITDPVPTKRIHDYWTKPGEEGYNKIGWGTPGDFNRCRVEIGQEIAEKDPEKVAKYMNQICAQWHHDATGYWPGKAPAERVAASGPAAPAVSLVASVPAAPAEWFTDPKFETLTPLTVTEEGQVFGHLCGWETCHTGFDGVCVAPPPSASGYAYFLTGEVLTDAGPVPVGQVTVGGGHAGKGLGVRAAIAHYDSTSAAVADVTCGEDEHGVWLAGWVRPYATDEQVYAMRAAAPSGDWRQVGGNMELIAAHSVNVQGFPVPRVGVGVRNKAQVSLVAAGTFEAEPEQDTSFDVEDFAEKVAAAIEARAARREKMAALAARIGGQSVGV